MWESACFRLSESHELLIGAVVERHIGAEALRAPAPCARPGPSADRAQSEPVLVEPEPALTRARRAREPAARCYPSRFFNKIKNSRRVATRYDKLASSFLGFVQLATIRIWIKFAHAA